MSYLTRNSHVLLITSIHYIEVIYQQEPENYLEFQIKQFISVKSQDLYALHNLSAYL
jgi:hypothetical protein